MTLAYHYVIVCVHCQPPVLPCAMVVYLAIPGHRLWVWVMGWVWVIYWVNGYGMGYGLGYVLGYGFEVHTF